MHPVSIHSYQTSLAAAIPLWDEFEGGFFLLCLVIKYSLSHRRWLADFNSALIIIPSNVSSSNVPASIE